MSIEANVRVVHNIRCLLKSFFYMLPLPTKFMLDMSIKVHRFFFLGCSAPVSIHILLDFPLFIVQILCWIRTKITENERSSNSAMRMTWIEWTEHKHTLHFLATGERYSETNKTLIFHGLLVRSHWYELDGRNGLTESHSAMTNYINDLYR